jgi:acyl-CoA synthetase (AMP-forming)/AMP-acid ligase II
VPKARDSIDAGTLERHCRANLAPYKLPRSYLVVERLPKTAVGKIDKQQLQRDAAG